MSTLGYYGLPHKRKRRRKSPAPFIVGGVTALILLASGVLWLNQGTVKPQPPAQVDGGQPATGAGAKPARQGAKSAGPKPIYNPLTGRLGIVTDYLQKHANDPDIQYVDWGNVALDVDPETGDEAWVVFVRFRARNAFNAVILHECTFVIRDSKVIDLIEK